MTTVAVTINKNNPDKALKQIFPKVKEALFNLAPEYKVPGDSPYYCHFCEDSSEDADAFQVHIKSEEHEKKVDKRKECLTELIKNFYTATQSKAVLISKSIREFNVCPKCLLPYFQGAKNHKSTDEHKYSVGFLRPECSTCAKYFQSRFDLEEHLVTLDHVYSTMAFNKRKEFQDNKGPLPLPDEYTGEPVGMEYVRSSTAFFCTPCEVYVRKTLKLLKEHCALESHIENVKEMEKKLKVVREERLKELEKKKKEKEAAASGETPAKKMKTDEEMPQEEEKEEEIGDMNMEEDEVVDDENEAPNGE